LTQESEIFNDSFLLDFSEFHPGYHEIHDRLFKLRGLPGRSSHGTLPRRGIMAMAGIPENFLKVYF
jgi:hypothetical protein